MCKPVAKPTWGYHPEQRVPVGYIDKENNYILLSEGDDPSGCYHDIWAPTEKGLQNGPPYIIDRVTKKNGKWSYKREFECEDLECAVGTFINLINPDFGT
ncbi:MAG: hypothetical protein Q8O05_07125 [Chloroflexota bacterium]|nr:hypothetical protein [Chloroflexota bacterium]